MSHNAEATAPVLVGREAELRAIDGFLRAAAGGMAGTFVLSGDAGVGKTALVQHASTAADPETLILAGACLPLASLTVPFLALRSAFRGAPRTGGIAQHAPGTAGEAPHDVPARIDAWLDELCLLRPVVLVIDDLQWADESTLDVLMYLIAGPAERRLAIVATLRSGEVAPTHPLRRWLADVRRLPRITWLTLGPLDRLDTETQLAGLLGAPPHQSLLQDVFTHTAGNAYLNRLVVQGLRPNAHHLPAELPADLTGAVLRSWHGLSPGARQLTLVMAVGGRPIRAQDLGAVARTDLGPEGVLALLHEAADAGITECGTEGTHWWFHHPLVAEVLEQGLDGDERQRWHRAFAAGYEDRVAASTTPNFEALVALADHHYAGGHTAEAYRWALRASVAARERGGAPEMLRLLRRAVTLRAGVPDADESLQDLWTRLRIAAEEAGSMEDELEAVEMLRKGTDAGGRPVDAAELLVRRAHLLFSMGRSFLTVDDMREAVRLSAVEPTGWQYALALAELAHVCLWHDDPAAEDYARQALAIARTAGNPRALSYALTANAMAAVMNGRPEEARDLATDAMTAAAQAREYWALIHATMWQANATEAWTSAPFADLMRAGRQQLEALGAPHIYVAKMAADEAGSYLAVGRWRECMQALRVALGSDPGTMGDVAARLTAARLAAWQGRQAEAQAHLARAEELYAQKSRFPNLDFDAVRTEVCLAGGDPEGAYAAAMAGADSEGRAPTMCEWLIPLAARALADQIRLARDEGRPVARLLTLTEELVRRFPAALREPGDGTELYTRQLTAFDLLYAAEVGRARERADNPTDWIRATDACQAGNLRWEEAYCCWRGVEALLLHGQAQRRPAASLLRRGLALVEVLQAAPIRAQLVELAARARIAIDNPAEAAPGAYAELPGLTFREREILNYVVAGRTYGEIARALVISEKTVSSHISNLLRKTGADNRLDLARRATRRSAGP